MRKLFNLCVIVALTFIISGCIHCKPCPSDDVIYFTMSPFGSIPMGIPKGFFTDENTKDWWMSKKEWDELTVEDEDKPEGILGKEV